MTGDRPPVTSESLLPDGRREQHQHRIQLKASRQHVEHQDVLGERLHGIEVAGRADLGEAGTDVIESTRHGSEDSLQVQTLDHRDRHHREDEDEHIGGEIDADTVQRAPVQRLAVHGHIRDRTGMQVFADLAVNGLEHDQHTRHLHAAARAARAGADEHDAYEKRSGILRPLVKILRRESRRRNDGAHLESRVVESMEHRGEHPPDVDGDRNDRERDHAEIGLDLAHPQHISLLIL